MRRALLALALMCAILAPLTAADAGRRALPGRRPLGIGDLVSSVYKISGLATAVEFLRDPIGEIEEVFVVICKVQYVWKSNACDFCGGADAARDIYEECNRSAAFKASKIGRLICFAAFSTGEQGCSQPSSCDNGPVFASECGDESSSGSSSDEGGCFPQDATVEVRGCPARFAHSVALTMSADDLRLCAYVCSAACEVPRHCGRQSSSDACGAILPDLQVAGGHTKRMDQLSIGDRVLTADPLTGGQTNTAGSCRKLPPRHLCPRQPPHRMQGRTLAHPSARPSCSHLCSPHPNCAGSLSYQPVYFFGHRLPNTPFPFMKLSTSAGPDLRLTADHHLPVCSATMCEPGSGFANVPARSVRAGDSVLLVQGMGFCVRCKAGVL